MLRIDVLTLFPGMFSGVLGESIIKRAQARRLARINVKDLRAYSRDRHRKVDDAPYGGGPGMILLAQPIFDAVRSLKKGGSKVILLSPQGRRFSQALANRLARQRHIILICGRYEGVDERVKKIITDEISIGDYVLTGGEIPAMAVVDAVTRMVPGVLGNKESNKSESFQSGLLEYPQYTRPREYLGLKVPQVLLTGNHKKIEEWRYKQSLKRTKRRNS
jgi:tRNA (guanine37-N1)-methyltransferase